MDKDVVEKCLAFCQALSSSSHLFSFNLKIGSDTFNFDLKELAKSSCAKKKKSPSQLKREKRRRDERERAKTKADKDTAQGSEKSVMVIKPQCDHCEKSFNSEEELNSHIESDHKALPTPEKERSIASCSELQLSPIHMQRDEEKLSAQEGASAPKSPPPSLSVVCDLRRGFNPYPSPWDPECGKTFTNEDDLRVHVHLAHITCFREKYSTPCPWEGCISHEVTQ